MRRSVVATCVNNCSLRLFQTISNAVVVFIVQCFFIRRIWVLSGCKHWLAVIFLALALTTLGGAIFFGVNGAGHSLYSKFHGVCEVSPFLRSGTYTADAEHTPVLIMWSVADMILDGSIATLLCYYLHKVRRPLPSYPGIG